MKTETSQKSKPVAVLISDIHFNIQTIELATAAIKQAAVLAVELDVPLVVAGDMHDTKANMRGECVNAMIECFCLEDLQSFVLIGNHDKINEKSETHSLNFLTFYTHVVSTPQSTFSIKVNNRPVHFIPYQHDPEAVREYLKTVDSGSCIIMHQGIEGSHSGDYIQDKSAINKDDVRDFRVISGHYHRRQDIKTGRPQKGAVGLFSYIGNPFTLGFGEAEDPSKGFQVLYNDGLMEHVETNLRKHIIYDIKADEVPFCIPAAVEPDDLVWIKIRGTKEELASYNRARVVHEMQLKEGFRLDLIPEITETNIVPNAPNQTQHELLDILIDSISNTSDEKKTRLKSLWRAMV